MISCHSMSEMTIRQIQVHAKCPWQIRCNVIAEKTGFYLMKIGIITLSVYVTKGNMFTSSPKHC